MLTVYLVSSLLKSTTIILLDKSSIKEIKQNKIVIVRKCSIQANKRPISVIQMYASKVAQYSMYS